MSEGCVTLEEVLAAASARHASLVPETSGYLALAVADASSRLPFRVDDRVVMLTTEGSVRLTRRGEMVEAREAARAGRSMLARLLAVSSGRMPGLAAAARSQEEESEDGVDGVAREIEAALIPLNRAAARRALARLARETLRAKESGKLRRALVAMEASPTAEQRPKRRSRRPVHTASAHATKRGLEPAATVEPHAYDNQALATRASEPALEAAFFKASMAVSDDEINLEVPVELEPTPTALGMAIAVSPDPLLDVISDEPNDHLTELHVQTAIDAPIGEELDLDSYTDLQVLTAVVESELCTPDPAPSSAPFIAIDLGPVLSCERTPRPSSRATLPLFVDRETGAARLAPWTFDPRSYESALAQPEPSSAMSEPAAEAIEPAIDPETTSEARTSAATSETRPCEATAGACGSEMGAQGEPDIAELLRRAARATATTAVPVQRSSNRVDELLARFGTPTQADANLRATKASLRAFVELDSTPEPPKNMAYVLPDGPTYAPLRATERTQEFAPTPANAVPSNAANGARSIAKVIAALLLLSFATAMLIWRLHPELFAFHAGESHGEVASDLSR